MQICKLSDNWQLPFFGSIALMGAGMLLALRMHPERPFAAQPEAA